MKPLGMVYGVIATFLWACFPALCKITLEYMTVYQFLLFRYLIAFGLLSWLTKRVLKKCKDIPLISWVLIFFMGSAHNVTQALCLRKIPVSWYILFFSCSPILTYFITPIDKHKGMYGVFFLALFGSYLFIDLNSMENPPSFMSLFYLFTSVMSWAYLTKLMMSFHEVYSDSEVSYVLNASNLITAVIIYSIFSKTTLETVSWENCLWPLLVIGISSPLAVILFSKSLRFVPTFCIAAQYVELAFGMLIGYSIFHEVPNGTQIVGCCLIVLALILTTFLTIKTGETV